MANALTTSFDYTYDGHLSTDVLLAPAVNAPDITKLFTIIPNLKHKQQINIGSQLGKMVQGDQGCGTINDTAEGVTITNRTIETCKMGFRLTECTDAFEGSIMVEATNAGIMNFNLSGTQIGTLINKMVIDNLQREYFRIFSFGDTTSPAGDPSYYGMCDGLWTRLIAGSASYEVTAVNSSISSLSASDTKGYFKALYEGADILLKQMPIGDKAFYVTGNVYEALMEYYEDNSNTGGFVAREENGVTSLFYRGIRVVHYYAWDSWIDVDNLGSNVRILYTTPKNHVIGLEPVGNQGVWDFWYDKNDKKNKIDGSFRLGYNYLHDKLQAYSIGNV